MGRCLERTHRRKSERRYYKNQGGENGSNHGLHQISIEEGGKEPSPAHLKELIDLCQTEDVRVIFVQPEFDKRNAETIAQQTGTKVVPINPLSYDWEEEMLNVAKALAPQTATN